jgi:hypothetical protein
MNMKRSPAVMKLVAVLAICGATVAFGEKLGKVDICHIPPGNPANAHTINVSENAVPAHLAHGDTLGPCGSGGELCSDVGDFCNPGPCPAGTTEVPGPFADCPASCCRLGS